MAEKSIPDGTWEYKYFDESEWRIIYSNEIKERLEQIGKKEILEKFRMPSYYMDDKEFKEMYMNTQQKPEFLIPLKTNKEKINQDPWFAMIIYPSLKVKVKSESDPEIRSLIEELKLKIPSKCISNTEKPAPFEPYSKPLEIDLDACRNF